MTIHSTAVIHPHARLENNVRVGPYCVVGPQVELKDNVELVSHVVIEGKTTLDDGVRVYPFVTLGCPPQHLGYKGEETTLDIGAHTQIREHVTVHRGTLMGGGQTRIGARCLIMVGSHIAHDCHVGNDVVMANQVALAGHTVVEDHVVFGGLVGIQQFTRIGEGAMVGGFSALGKDVIPYGIAIGNRGGLEGINVKKLRRLGKSKAEVMAVYKLYQWLFHNEQETFLQRVRTIPSEWMAFETVVKIQKFIMDREHRPLCMPQKSWDEVQMNIDQELAE